MLQAPQRDGASLEYDSTPQASSLPETSARVESIEDSASLEHDAAEGSGQTSLIAGALRAWMAENKRLPDFRLLTRDMEQLLAGLQSVSCEELDGQRSLSICVGHASSTTRLRTLYTCRNATEQATCGVDGVSLLEVDVYLFASAPGQSVTPERTFVEFHGRRDSRAFVDEAMAWVDYEFVRSLQASLMPSLPLPIVMLDMLLSLPVAPAAGSPIPFRACILEDMLADECWAEGDDDTVDSDEELARLQYLSLEAEVQIEEVARGEGTQGKSECSVPGQGNSGRKPVKRVRS